MALVFAWPPVVSTMKTWNLETPISRSYGMLTGKRFASGAGSPRRKSRITVHGQRKNGIGHLAALERLLKGGLNFVRLTSCRMAYGEPGDFGVNGRGGSYFEWRENSAPSTLFGWQTPPESFAWFEGAQIHAAANASSGGFSVTVTGQLPVNSVVAMPGEFITVFTAANPEGETHMVINTAVTGSFPPEAIIRLATPATGSGRVNLNTSETGVFELNSTFPDLGRSGGIDTFSLDFREIFPEEVEEGLVEQNPWT